MSEDAALLRPGLRVGTVELVQSLDLRHGEPQWLVRCDCGSLHVVRFWKLAASAAAIGRRGRPPVLCGDCLAPRPKGRRTRHGMSKTAEYHVWYGAYTRCHKPGSHGYADYGGRGIRMCREWHPPGDPGFLRFLEHVGPRPSAKHSLDRIDNDAGYEPGNVRWATWGQQIENRRIASKDTWKPSHVRRLVEATLGELGVWSGLFGFALRQPRRDIEDVLSDLVTPPPTWWRYRGSVRSILVTASMQVVRERCVSHGRLKPPWPIGSRGGDIRVAFKSSRAHGTGTFRVARHRSLPRRLQATPARTRAAV